MRPEDAKVSKMRRAVFGFTLIEVLAALSLMSLLMLALVGVVHAVGQTESRVQERIDALDDYRLAGALLGTALGNVSMRSGGHEEPGHFFIADETSLQWVGTLPARYGVGGLHYLRLATERNIDGQDELALRYTPWRPVEAVDWSQAQRLVLAEPLTAVRLRYQDAQGAWFDRWPPTDDEPQRRGGELPATAAINVALENAVWPPIVVPLRVTAQSDPALRMWGR